MPHPLSGILFAPPRKRALRFLERKGRGWGGVEEGVGRGNRSQMQSAALTQLPWTRHTLPIRLKSIIIRYGWYNGLKQIDQEMANSFCRKE